MGTHWRSRFAELVCGYTMPIWYLLWFNVAFLLLGVYAFQYTDPGTPSSVVLKLDFAINAIVILSAGALLLFCRRRS